MWSIRLCHYRSRWNRTLCSSTSELSVLSQLGDYNEIAIKVFLALERRLNSYSHLKRSYSDFVEEYHRLHHMEDATDIAVLDNNAHSYSFPHYYVRRPDSLCTKFRVFIDASVGARYSSTCRLMVGSTVQNDLVVITLRFLMSRYGDSGGKCTDKSWSFRLIVTCWRSFDGILRPYLIIFNSYMRNILCALSYYQMFVRTQQNSRG